MEEKRRSNSKGRGRGRGRRSSSRGRHGDHSHRQQRSSSSPPNVESGSPKRKSSAGCAAAGEGSSSGQQRFSGGTLGVVPKMQQLNLSKGASQSSDTNLVPMKRPDSGGNAESRNINILVNHFPVSFSPESIIRHYDIDIKPEVASKAKLSMLMAKFFADHPEFPEKMTVFDGEKNVFSAVPLPPEILTVNLSPQECHTYKFHFDLVNELKLHKLKDYLTGNLLQLPREVLQGMDVVMKENPRKHMVSIGKTFHPIDPRGLPLYKGLETSEGFQHTIKPTSQGLALCLDYSVLAVRKRVSVLQFLKEHINLDKVSSHSFRERRREIEMALKGLRVRVTHRRTNQTYIISGLTDQNACDISFPRDDPDGQKPPTTLPLLKYFQEEYPGECIQHREIPCLSLGKGKRPNDVPIELCVLVEGQRFPKDNLNRNSARLLKDKSLVSPVLRRQKICDMLQSKHGPAGGEISRNFEINVATSMTQVKGRVIEPPTLKLRSVSKEVCRVNVNNNVSRSWNLGNRSFVEGISLKYWAVLDFSSCEKKADRLNDKDFLTKLIRRCEKLGLSMKYPLVVKRAGMRSLKNGQSVSTLLESVQSEARENDANLQLILCVMTRKDSGYKYIKWISEKKIGVVTQCCLSNKANNAQDQYLANLGMKINGKLGGSNVELINHLPLFDKDADRVMLIGADVNHPRPLDFSSPSIAAVVASMNWPAANKYVPRISTQGHCVEKIEGFGRICLQLIECYEKENGFKPEKLVIFRDGVSEGQFDMVLNIELWDLLNTLDKEYRPTITLIVAQKRHKTRLFVETPSDVKENIPPGTVVDTTIVHPWEFDFYLCSHNGSIGTSKPTHYQVLWDEHGFTSDDLQKFIYDLCFTFARCCNPVSLAPPVYYADLLAYRGRLHYDAQFDQPSSSGNLSFSSAASSSSTSATLSEITILHANIQDIMYFI